nr:hypothetical protein [uncultured bacterium]
MAKRRPSKFRIPFDAQKASRLITFLGVLSAIVITTWVWIIYQPGRATHKTLQTEQTKFRLSLQPEMIQSYISSLAPGITHFINVVPKVSSLQSRAFRVDWVHALPYEITFLGDIAAPDKLNMTLYVNTIPDNGSFVGEVNASGALRELQPIRWNGPQLNAVAEQQFTAKGTVSLLPELAQVLEVWPKSAGTLPTFNGGHLVEFEAENGSGVLLALHQAFQDTAWKWASEDTNAGLVAIWRGVQKVEVLGDLTHGDELSFNLKLTGNRSLDRNTAEAVFNAATEELRAYLSEAQLDFSGQLSWANSLTCTGEFRLTGFEARIQRIWR